MIIDCFTFWNELDVLDIRLNTLGPVVDRFVLVEATTTFSGQPNEPTFRELCSIADAYGPDRTGFPRILEWREKIEHVVVDDMPRVLNGDRWPLEHWQRNAILRGLHKIGPASHDLVLVGDVDEIPDPVLVGIPGVHWMKLYYYYLDRYLTEWPGTAGVPFEQLVRDYQSPEMLRQAREALRRIEGGWHFSCLGGPKMAVAKLRAFAHSELDTPEGHKKVTDGIRLRVDHNGRGALRLVDPGEPGAFPPYLVANWDRFRHLADDAR